MNAGDILIALLVLNSLIVINILALIINVNAKIGIYFVVFINTFTFVYTFASKLLKKKSFIFITISLDNKWTRNK